MKALVPALQALGPGGCEQAGGGASGRAPAPSRPPALTPAPGRGRSQSREPRGAERTKGAPPPPPGRPVAANRRRRYLLRSLIGCAAANRVRGPPARAAPRGAVRAAVRGPQRAGRVVRSRAARLGDAIRATSSRPCRPEAASERRRGFGRAGLGSIAGSCAVPGSEALGRRRGCPLPTREVKRAALRDQERRQCHLARLGGRGGLWKEEAGLQLVVVGSIHSLIESVIDTSYSRALGTQTAVAPAEAWGLASPQFPLVSPPNYSKWNVQACFLIWAIDTLLHFYGTLRQGI